MYPSFTCPPRLQQINRRSLDVGWSFMLYIKDE